MDVTLRRTGPADIPECGRILYEAFATLADRHGFPPDFPSVEAATGSMRALISNPGFYGVVAEVDGRVAGSSFLDERSTIHAIGPVSVDPAAQDHHVGRALMIAMLERAKETGTPGVRLVQISYHNRSLSLYAKLGLDVRGTYAAMHGELIRHRSRATPCARRRRPTKRPATPSACGSTVTTGRAKWAARSPTARRRSSSASGGSRPNDGRPLLRPLGCRDERRPPGAHRCRGRHRDAGDPRPRRQRRPLPLVPGPRAAGLLRREHDGHRHLPGAAGRVPAIRGLLTIGGPTRRASR